jgi:hypothetical protein
VRSRAPSTYSSPRCSSAATEQQRRADPFGQHAWSVEIGLQRGEQQHLLALPRSGGKQRGQATTCCEFIGAAKGGDHGLADGAAFALVLDDLQVAARPGLLDTEKHGVPLQDTTIRASRPGGKGLSGVGRGTTY